MQTNEKTARHGGFFWVGSSFNLKKKKADAETAFGGMKHHFYNFAPFGNEFFFAEPAKK